MDAVKPEHSGSKMMVHGIRTPGLFEYEFFCGV
jgi:hypothetical protein